ncbi:hypothetical protein HanPI659440_Chr16g0643111 [Helianthus annuus]|nr:hypothetical protein HanPI659440_Chr16g0643111 [Helianthus annuus]
MSARPLLGADVNSSLLTSSPLLFYLTSNTRVSHTQTLISSPPTFPPPGRHLHTRRRPPPPPPHLPSYPTSTSSSDIPSIPIKLGFQHTSTVACNVESKERRR